MITSYPRSTLATSDDQLDAVMTSAMDLQLVYIAIHRMNFQYQMNEDVWNDLSKETQEQLQTILDGETNCYEFISL